MTAVWKQLYLSQRRKKKTKTSQGETQKCFFLQMRNAITTSTQPKPICNSCPGVPKADICLINATSAAFRSTSTKFTSNRETLGFALSQSRKAQLQAQPASKNSRRKAVHPGIQRITKMSARIYPKRLMRSLMHKWYLKGETKVAWVCAGRVRHNPRWWTTVV